MPTRSRRLQQRKRTFVRDEIWAAAIDRFTAHGYEATAVEEIAAAAGVSRRTFFRYFSSKDDVMVKAIDTYGDLLTRAIRGAATPAAPLDVIRHAVARVAEVVVAQPRVRETMTITFASLAAQRAQLAELEVVKGRIAGEFARALGRRPAKPYTAAVMASLMISVLTLTFRAWYEGPARPIEPIVDEILDALAGLLALEPERRRDPNRPRRRSHPARSR